jgi:hypothetical protein
VNKIKKTQKIQNTPGGLQKIAFPHNSATHVLGDDERSAAGSLGCIFCRSVSFTETGVFVVSALTAGQNLYCPPFLPDFPSAPCGSSGRSL